MRLNFRGCAAKVLYAAQLPRRSSSRVGAVRRDEREGEERGKLEPRSLFKDFISILIGLSLHTVLENHHSLRENHDLFNTFYYCENSKLANQVVPRIEGATKN